MLLPKCVRVDAHDKQSARALKSDDWRRIGKLNEYRGKVNVREPEFVGEVERGGDRAWILEAVPRFDFKGRLWRDKSIPIEDAIDETRRFIGEARDHHLFHIPHKGFMICRGHGGWGVSGKKPMRIQLIGVLERRSGVGRRLVEAAAVYYRNDFFVAGTYSDNESAKSLYLSLPLSLVGAYEVFHK